MVDGRVIPRNNVGRNLPVAARDMSDLSIALKAHGRAGHRYPGDLSDDFYFSAGAPAADIDLAICRSYNRWMADIVKQSAGPFSLGGRAAVAKHGSLAEELKFGKENGACGVYMRGLEAERQLQRSLFLSDV